MQNVADLINPETGNTYRADNAKKSHRFPLGTLVEIKTQTDPKWVGVRDGMRLFVVYCGRDCDQTPLYWLSQYTPEELSEFLERGESLMETSDAGLRALGFSYKEKSSDWIGGYAEESLIPIRFPLDRADSYQIDWFSSEWPYDFVSNVRPGGTLFETANLQEAQEQLEKMCAMNKGVHYRIIPIVDGRFAEHYVDIDNM